MSPSKDSPASPLKAFRKALFSALGANEVLFLLGMAALFEGIRGLWSIDGALTVCGALLVVIAVAGVLVAQRRQVS